MIFNLSLSDTNDIPLIQKLASLPKSSRSRWIREQLYIALDGQPALNQVLEEIRKLSGVDIVLVDTKYPRIVEAPSMSEVPMASLPENDTFFSEFGK